MNRIALSALVSLAGCVSLTTQAAVAPEPPRLTEPADEADRALEFMLPEPQDESLGAKQRLWATWYYMPTVRAASLAAFAVPLKGRKGEDISAPLTKTDWCNAALQGSVWVERPDGDATAYVFVDARGPQQTDCGGHLGNLSTGIKNATGRARFATFKHPAGCDVRRYPLQPYRTIAVDPHRFRMGTVLYSPDLRGQVFRYRGEVYVHDGYLIASDRGGAIKGNHIDVFVEDPAGVDPLPNIIQSNPGGAFDAYPVKSSDPAAAALKDGQKRTCDEPLPRWRPPPSETI
ncbi:MAG: 3D domain-containing protein [Hyphomonadaceae bacterium]